MIEPVLEMEYFDIDYWVLRVFDNPIVDNFVFQVDQHIIGLWIIMEGNIRSSHIDLSK